ncbi:hypothetical protein ACFY0P_36790 [Streptomyces sp. NPDC001714]|uniref:hypothetical protein n=1 Tax=Streptomyces sp. NPDC001714 TaxID=3364603 RepID=UPI00367CE459
MPARTGTGHSTERPVPMETVGWIAAAVATIGGASVIVGHALDQASVLSSKAVRALRAAAKLRDEWRNFRHHTKAR